MERLLRPLFFPYLIRTNAFGENQFAHTPGRGARDALAHLVLTWVTALASGYKIAVYCSDVSGALDRVRAERLVEKLRAKKVHGILVRVVESWLRKRKAYVVVGGMMSEAFDLENMVFQGNVWVPALWNLFYENARKAIQ